MQENKRVFRVNALYICNKAHWYDNTSVKEGMSEVKSFDD